MAVETKLVTVSEFVTLPDLPNGRYELRNGAVVLVPPVKLRHTKIQANLVKLMLAQMQVTDFERTVTTDTIDDAVPLATGASIPVRAIFEK